jgi:hypothetical protein
MTDTFIRLIQFVVGGCLLCFLVWLKLHDAQHLMPLRLQPWTRKLGHVGLSVLAVSVLLDPIIPGSPSLTITVSTKASAYPTLLENLRVRVTPLGFRNAPGGDRVAYSAFDQNGTAHIRPNLAFLETRVAIEVFDLTRPLEVIRQSIVYVSPFVRCQLVTKTITL